MISNKKRILIVDDEITVCKSIRSALLAEDSEVDMALSGEEALKKQQENHYDLIISDLMMPGISGLDLLKSLKELTPDTQVIMVTGYPTIKTAVEAVKLGAFDYIPKPFTPAELRGLVSRVFFKATSERMELKCPAPPKLPSGLYCMRGHSWVRRDEQEKATLGILYDYVNSIGKVMHIELPEEGSTIFQGDVCAQLTDQDKFQHRIWAPATGRIIQINPILKDDPNLIKQDPYDRGWLLKLESPSLDDDLVGLYLSV